MSDVETAHEFCWRFGLCTAQQSEPRECHGAVCIALADRDALHRASARLFGEISYREGEDRARGKAK